MNSNAIEELYKKIAERAEEDKKERELNQLSQYSTSQLKAELRRRKGDR